MADEENKSPDDELDAQALADSVADGVAEAQGEDADLADEWAAAMEEAGETPDEPTDEDIADDWAAAMAEETETAKASSAKADKKYRNMELDELHDEGQAMPENDNGPELDVILDIPVRISMEVGSTQIPIRNLLQLNQGSVVELDRLAGEPLDVLVNGTLIAHGEVVMVNDKFGIRLTDVVSQSERIQRLR